jgi:pentalenene oxygenase
VDHGDLLSILLTSRDDESGGGELSDTEIGDQVLTFFIAGAETTGNLLAWALHLLAEHPGIQERVHTEVGSVLSGPTATSAELALLPLTSNVVSEVLRLYPPVWFLTRRVSRDTVLGGCPLPTGTTVAFSPYAVHRLPAVYPDAAVFDPDRWSDPLPAPIPPGAYVPFIAGARKCIGDVFGTSEAILALTSVVARWRLDPVPGAPVRFARDIVVKPRELRLRVTRRDRPHPTAR